MTIRKHTRTTCSLLRFLVPEQSTRPTRKFGRAATASPESPLRRLPLEIVALRFRVGLRPDGARAHVEVSPLVDALLVHFEHCGSKTQGARRHDAEQSEQWTTSSGRYIYSPRPNFSGKITCYLIVRLGIPYTRKIQRK